jgi:hypothetical protein
MRDKLLVAMLPGCWHRRKEIVDAAGLSRSAHGKFNQELLPAGLVECARDPDGPARKLSRATGWPWLYRLTWRGELERAAMALLE